MADDKPATTVTYRRRSREWPVPIIAFGTAVGLVGGTIHETTQRDGILEKIPPKYKDAPSVLALRSLKGSHSAEETEKAFKEAEAGFEAEIKADKESRMAQANAQAGMWGDTITSGIIGGGGVAGGIAAASFVTNRRRRKEADPELYRDPTIIFDESKYIDAITFRGDKYVIVRVKSGFPPQARQDITQRIKNVLDSTSEEKAEISYELTELEQRIDIGGPLDLLKALQKDGLITEKELNAPATLEALQKIEAVKAYDTRHRQR